MMMLNSLCLWVLLCFFNITVSGENVVSFLEKERKYFQKDGIKCSLKKISARTSDHFRLTSQIQASPDVIVCLLDGLMEKDLQKSEILWSALGSMYQRLKQDQKATVCFKQAMKLTGKVSTHVKDWSFIGPFVIGKMEVDGDPIEAFGGIRNASKTRFMKNLKYFSELLPGGEVKWSHVKQASPSKGLNIQPSVNWNDLVNSLGSMGILEWQGWVVGEISVNENDLNVAVQCFGVHTVFIDDIPVAGDVYHRDKYWYGIKLNRGLHSVYVRLRSKVNAQFSCKFDTPKSSFEILKPDFLPDLVDGKLFGSYVSFPIANYHSSKFLKISKVSMSDLDSKVEQLQNELVVKLTDAGTLIAPGQIYPVVLKLSVKSDSSTILSKCLSPESDWDIKFNLKFTTSAGTSTMSSMKLRCRSSHQSFIFTFVDHDGSVQHAAAIQPQEECPLHICPVMLSLHGTTIPAQNQADSYKHMVNGEFLFGFPHAWTLAPTRHGAHNWEGPGLLTALTAVESLATLTSTHKWIPNAADGNRIVYAGHSMGGHGAWHIATHYPDRALALVSLAGWIKKEEYGDSNLFFRHDIATSRVSPAVKSVLESCIVENDADQHVSNLHGVPVVLRIGASDRTVHPWFVRRMYRLLKEEGIMVNYTEVEDKEHWWWDTIDTNDGGAVNDKYLRDFVNKHVDASLSDYRTSAKECIDGECDEGASDGMKRYQDVYSTFTLVCYNPALGEGMHGVRVLQQLSPYKKSKIQVTVNNDRISLITNNVRRLSLSSSTNRDIDWWNSNLMIDGAELDLTKMKSPIHLCFTSGKWDICTESLHSVTNRGPLTLGPARRIAENTLRVIIGTQGSDMSQVFLQRAAVYITNLFLLTSDARVAILKDSDVQVNELESTNIILLGNSEENLHTEHFLKNIPVKHSSAGITLEGCNFSEPRTGLLSLAPNGDTHLALLLLSNTMDGIQDVVSLAAPTIPPMTRSPFSNLIPDFIITGPKFGSQGPGGYSCAGFYGNHWEYRPDLTSCFCVH